MADLTPFPPYERNFGNMFPDSDATRQSPGRAFGVGGLCPPLSDKLKAKLLYNRQSPYS